MPLGMKRNGMGTHRRRMDTLQAAIGTTLIFAYVFGLMFVLRTCVDGNVAVVDVDVGVHEPIKER